MGKHNSFRKSRRAAAVRNDGDVLVNVDLDVVRVPASVVGEQLPEWDGTRQVVSFAGDDDTLNGGSVFWFQLNATPNAYYSV